MGSGAKLIMLTPFETRAPSGWCGTLGAAFSPVTIRSPGAVPDRGSDALGRASMYDPPNATGGP